MHRACSKSVTGSRSSLPQDTTIGCDSQALGGCHCSMTAWRQLACSKSVTRASPPRNQKNHHNRSVRWINQLCAIRTVICSRQYYTTTQQHTTTLLLFHAGVAAARMLQIFTKFNPPQDQNNHHNRSARWINKPQARALSVLPAAVVAH